MNYENIIYAYDETNKKWLKIKNIWIYDKEQTKWYKIKPYIYNSENHCWYPLFKQVQEEE